MQDANPLSGVAAAFHDVYSRGNAATLDRMNRSRFAVPIVAPIVARLALAGMFGLTGLALAGCGGGGDEKPANRSSNSSPSMKAPAFDASANDVARYLDGRWRITLLPEAGEVDVNAPSVSASFDAGDFADGPGMAETADLSGNVGDQQLSGGGVTVMKDASAYPSLSFTTDGMSVPSLTGEGTTDVPGPIEWTGTLVDGRIVGEATGSGGTAAWEARRQ